MAQNRYYSSTAASAQLSGSLTSGTTTFTVTTATGWPASTPFTLVLERDTANEEVVTVTSVTGTTVTCTRGSDGTTAVAHATGAKVEHGVSARDYDEPQKHIAASTNVHGLGAASAVVGTTDTQTLSGKTLTTPTISSFVNATHSHGTAATGGQLFQANTHGGADTDTATTSLHHTLGTGANQAAAGSHTHTAFTNLALTTPSITGSGGALTLPAGPDTLVGRTTTDTLTNKTLTAPTVSGGSLDAASTIGGVSGTALSGDRTSWTAYTPGFSNVTGGAVNAFYKQVGKILFLRVHFTSGTATATGQIGFNLPGGMTAAGSGTQIAAGNGVPASFTIAAGVSTMTSSGSLTSGAGLNGILCCGHIELA